MTKESFGKDTQPKHAFFVFGANGVLSRNAYAWQAFIRGFNLFLVEVLFFMHSCVCMFFDKLVK